jgi:4-hydroxy-tetrahydrodipicolinate synthase
VVANVAPRLMHEMCAAALAGDAVRARALNARLLGLHQQLFCEANPIPVKWACQELGLIDGGLRLPLTPLSPIVTSGFALPCARLAYSSRVGVAK